VIAFVDVAQSCIVKVDGVSFTTSFSPYPQLPFWYEDVRAHGASTAATAAANRTAIQATVDAVIARGGGTVLIPGRFHIAGGPIEVDAAGDTLAGVIFQGISTHGAALIQDTASADLLCFGRSGDTPKADINSAYQCGVRDLTLQGGRVGLRLNNAIEGHWYRVYFQDNAIGLYTEGQCEDHWFEGLHFSGQSSYGMDLGVDNGLGGAFQELQKTTFKKIRMHGVLPNAINAIRVSGGLGATGTLVFDGVTLEDGPGNWIDLTGNISQVTFKGLSIEESSVALTDTGARGAVPSGGWRVITQGAGCSLVNLIDCPILAPSDNFGHKYGYVFDQQNGTSYIQNCVFIGFGGGLATNAAINLQNGGAVIIGGAVGDHTQITTQGATAKAGTITVGVRDSTGAIITNWDDNGVVAYLASNAAGLVMGQRTYGDTQNTQDRAYHTSVSASGLVDLGTQSGYFHLFDGASGSQATFTTNGVAHSVTEVSDPDTIFRNSDGAGTWAGYWNGSTFVLKNETVGTRIVSWTRTDFNS